MESRQCVGKVEYLVKATPRTDSSEATAAAAGYGVPFGAPQRFAMCKLWPVQGCGYTPTQFTSGRRGRPHPSQHSKQLADALVASGVCSGPNDIQRLYDLVEAHSQVFKASKPEEEHLRLHTGAQHVAVPLDATLQDKGWLVQPVVKIKPGATAVENQAAAQSQQNTDQAFRKAAKKWASCDQFWVHTYGLSRRH